MCMLKTAKYFLFSLVILTPYLGGNYFISPYVDAKTIYIRFVAFAVFLFLTIGLFTKKTENKIFEKINTFKRDIFFWILSAGILSLLLSTIFAYNRTIAFFGESQRAEGFLTLFAVYVLYIGFRLVFEKRDWSRFFLASVLSSIPIFFIQFVKICEGLSRPDALSGNPTFLQGYYIFILFTALITIYNGFITGEKYYKIIGIIGLVTTILGMFFTGTRGGLLGLGMSVLVASIFIIADKKQKKLRKFGIIMLGFLCLFSGIFFSTRSANIWQDIPGLNRVLVTNSEDSTTESRLVFWQTSIKGMISDGNIKNLAIGWGWDNFLYFWGFHNNPKVYLYEKSVIDRSHNKFVDMFVMTGILGLLIYMILWFYFFKRVFFTARKSLYLGIIFLIYAITYITFLLFAFDVPMMIIGFYSILAYLQSYE